MELILDLFSRYSQKLATIATILLVVLITLSVANTSIFILDQYNQTDVPPGDSNIEITDGTTKARIPARDIVALNLFGKVNPGKIVTPLEAPETKLRLELQGVFTAENESQSSAIVAETNKEGLLYRIGEKLPGNVILSAVYANHILMKRGARFETLSFSDDAFRTAPQSGSTGSNGRTDKSNRRTGRSTSASIQRDLQTADTPRPPPTARSLTPGRRTQSANTSISDFVNANKQQLEQDPTSLLSELGIESVSSGEARGYTLAGEIPDMILRRSGLQRGDVILSVNGQPVGVAMEDTALIDSAMAQGRVRVEVKRADRRFFVTVPTR